MSLIKRTNDLSPIFPNVTDMFFGKLIGEDVFGMDKVTSVPSVNVADKRKAFEVTVATPGLNKKDLKLEVKGNFLVISSEKRHEDEKKQDHWVRREFGYTSFHRMFQLPPNADPEKIKATMKRGVLKIKIGKKKEIPAKKQLIAVH